MEFVYRPFSTRFFHCHGRRVVTYFTKLVHDVTSIRVENGPCQPAEAQKTMVVGENKRVDGSRFRRGAPIFMCRVALVGEEVGFFPLGAPVVPNGHAHFDM